MMGHKDTAIIALLAFLPGIGLPVTGCLKDRCDAGQILVAGQCSPVTASMDAGGRDGSSDRRARGDSSLQDGRENGAALGATCKGEEDCSDNATFCVVMPGDETGYCTIEKCTVTPNNCPSGYLCMDISLYVPGIPNLCIAQ